MLQYNRVAREYHDPRYKAHFKRVLNRSYIFPPASSCAFGSLRSLSSAQTASNGPGVSARNAQLQALESPPLAKAGTKYMVGMVAAKPTAN